jgi:D-xylose 1-dehydrogenase (NADP+, D-xylono-1,5-lactone-forming)
MSSEIKRPSYRVGIVGAGGIAETHAEVLTNRLEEANLAAICDISPEVLDRFGDAYGLSGRYLDLGDMLDKEDLDIVIVCNWGIDHATTVIQIAESRKAKAILCEKPFAMNAAEAEQMAGAAEENGVLLAEAYKFRHHPMHLKAKAMIEEGAIGEVISVRSTLFSGRRNAGPDPRTSENNWRFCKAKGGGSVNDLGCYCLAHARFVYGAEPLRLFAHPRMGVEVDEGAAVQLIFPDSHTAQFTVGFNAWPSQGVEISGSNGSLRMDKPWNNSDKATILEYRSFGVSTTIQYEPLLQYTCQLQHLCECLSKGHAYRITLAESINQMRALDGITESIATGQIVDL